MWMDYYLRAESEEAFANAVPADWTDDHGDMVGAHDVAVDVIGPVGEWFLVNLRLKGPVPEGVQGMLIEAPAHPKRVFA